MPAVNSKQSETFTHTVTDTYILIIFDTLYQLKYSKLLTQYFKNLTTRVSVASTELM